LQIFFFIILCTREKMQSLARNIVTMNNPKSFDCTNVNQSASASTIRT